MQMVYDKPTRLFWPEGQLIQLAALLRHTSSIAELLNVRMVRMVLVWCALNLLSSLKQMQNVQILHQNFLNSSQIPDRGILARQAHYGTLAKLSIQITS